MANANTPAVRQALELIFNKPAIEHGIAVKVMLDKQVTPEQLQDLTALCRYLHNFPGIIRSGTGVTVLFGC